MKNYLFLSVFVFGAFYSKSQQLKSDTIYKINPIIEMKKGVILQSCALAIFGATTIAYIGKPPVDIDGAMKYGVLYGTSAVAFFVGTVYVVQGLNYMYKPTKMGHWSFTPNPVRPSIAYNF